MRRTRYLILAAVAVAGWFLLRKMRCVTYSDVPRPWLRLGPQETALDDLDEFGHQLERALDRPSSIKWAVMALHSSLQNFFVSSAVTGDPAVVLKNHAKVRRWYRNYLRNLEATRRRLGSDEKALEAWMDSYVANHPKPQERLCDFLPLCKMALGEGHPDYRVIEELHNEFRNEFEHLKSLAWSVSIPGLLALFEECLPVLERFACHARPAKLMEKQEERGRQLIDHIRGLLSQLGARYAARS